jgi:hypothetical protein
MADRATQLKVRLAVDRIAGGRLGRGIFLGQRQRQHDGTRQRVPKKLI